jgi:RNA polymerase sigma-70 factor (ECF subfamily)
MGSSGASSLNPTPTSVSLLDRLKVARPDASDWHRLQGIYLPLIRRWLGRVPGLGDEADDLAQEVFIVVVRELPRFERRREGSFRAWLRKVTVNKTRSHWRRRRRMPAAGLDPAAGFLDRLEAPNGDLAREWDRDHDRHVFERLLAIVQPDFQPITWDAFRRFALDGLPAARVAEELGLTENAVLQAKSRILKRLRVEAGDLLK